MKWSRVFLFITLCVALRTVCLAKDAPKNVELAYEEAVHAAKKDSYSSMKICEAILSEQDHDPNAPKVYLLLGRLKMKVERECERVSDNDGMYLKCRKRFEQYAAGYPAEYQLDEISGQYLYNGIHFTKILQLFPSSELVDDAAYELTNLSLGGECEGFVDCYIFAYFGPVAKFLEKYPESPFAEKAVERANNAFLIPLKNAGLISENGNMNDLTKATYEYSPTDVRNILAQYEKLAMTLPAKLKEQAFQAICPINKGFRESKCLP